MTNEWRSTEHAQAYLAGADTIPHRTEGEAELLEHLPTDARRVLDLGSGDSRLLDLVLRRCPQARGVALDFSPAMLDGLRARFAVASRRDRRPPLLPVGDDQVRRRPFEQAAGRLTRSLLEEIGFADVDCAWKWREMALLVATRPG